MGASPATPALPPLVILGAGGHAVSLAGVAWSAGYAVRHFVAADQAGSTLLGVAVVAELAALGDLSPFAFAIAIGDNAARERLCADITARHGELRFPALVHASAVVGAFAHIGAGSVLMPGAIVGANATVARFGIVNTRASLDHDSRMDDFSSLAPGAVTGGRVMIGRRSAVSIGAVVRHGIRIGEDSVLGANSYLDRDLPPLTVAYGSPARPIRTRSQGEPYL